MEHGQYVNPGNSGFQVIINSEYIDKTGLIGQMNSRIGSPEGMVCVSRPRRFGKSYAAKMLCAYYDSSCDSRELFDGRAISKMDGYDFPGCEPIYNPYSVMRAIRARKCRSYWQRTSAAESLFTYINMDFEGLQELIARLIAGEEIEVDVDGFENDFESFRSKDDILTLLIHLGYLAYQEDEKTVHIPNKEVRNEFHTILRKTRNGSGSSKSRSSSLRIPLQGTAERLRKPYPLYVICNMPLHSIMTSSH